MPVDMKKSMGYLFIEKGTPSLKFPKVLFRGIYRVNGTTLPAASEVAVARTITGVLSNLTISVRMAIVP